MAEFARSLSGPRSLDERLRAVTDEVVELMPPKACAGILLVSGKRFETVAPTSPLLQQIRPCTASTRTGTVCVAAALNNPLVRSDDLRSEPR